MIVHHSDNGRDSTTQHQDLWISRLWGWRWAEGHEKDEGMVLWNIFQICASFGVNLITRKESHLLLLAATQLLRSVERRSGQGHIPGESLKVVLNWFTFNVWRSFYNCGIGDARSKMSCYNYEPKWLWEINLINISEIRFKFHCHTFSSMICFCFSGKPGA